MENPMTKGVFVNSPQALAVLRIVAAILFFELEEFHPFNWPASNAPRDVDVDVRQAYSNLWVACSSSSDCYATDSIRVLEHDGGCLLGF
jgi:hypothetical protein